MGQSSGGKCGVVVAVGQTVLGSHFGAFGAPPILEPILNSGDWDVHWGYGILTHGLVYTDSHSAELLILILLWPQLETCNSMRDGCGSKPTKQLGYAGFGFCSKYQVCQFGYHFELRALWRMYAAILVKSSDSWPVHSGN